MAGTSTSSFCQAGPSNSKRSDFKPGGDVDPYLLDIAPMNMVEYEVISNGIYTIKKKKNDRKKKHSQKCFSLLEKFM